MRQLLGLVIIAAAVFLIIGGVKGTYKQGWSALTGGTNVQPAAAKPKTDANGNPPGFSDPGDNPYVGGL